MAPNREHTVPSVHFHDSPPPHSTHSCFSRFTVLSCVLSRCSDVCSAELSGFHYDYDGVWTPVDGVFQGGAPVYSRVTYGSTNYLFKLASPNGDGWDAWVIGYAHDGSLGYWGWRWGGNLFSVDGSRFADCKLRAK